MWVLCVSVSHKYITGMRPEEDLDVPVLIV